MTAAYAPARTVVSTDDTHNAAVGAFEHLEWIWRQGPIWHWVPGASQVRQTMTTISYSPDRENLVVLLTHRYQLLRPIRLHRTIVGDGHFVFDDLVHCWGEGESFEQARADYEANLIDMYEDLANSKEPLSRLAEDHLNALRRHLKAE